MTNPSDIDRELLPCPFCGCEAELMPWSGPSYTVECNSGKKHFGITTHYFKIESNAVEAWNTRAQPEWRDISTAPKDGTFVLTCMPFACPSVSAWQTYFDISRFGKDPETFMTEDGFIMYWVEVEYQPTHWMPLPKAPS